MTICLVRCPSPFLIDERAFPPLGLMAVGAGLKRDGHKVVIYDGELEQLPLDYDYYGFGPTSPEYPHALDCLHRIKKANPLARVVIGGPHVTLLHEQCRDDGFDCMVVGDGENEASRAFFGYDEIIHAESLPLDEYPIADRTLVDIKSYSFRLHDRPTTTVMGSRGCPFQCAFCCKNHNRVRLSSAERMIEEIGILHEQFGYDAVAFPEDIFILDKARTKKVCAYLKEKGIIWRCLVRADLIIRYGSEFIDMMVDSGCVGVGLGIESGSNTILKNVNKGETAEQMVAAVKLLKDRGMFVKGFFIVGLPGENEDTLAETDAFLREVQMDDIDCKIFQPYPSSPIGDNPDQYDIKWEAIPLEYTFYKGVPGEYYGNISTSALSNDRIVEAWTYFEQTYKDWTYAIEGVMA
jgi:anaerobic magnesium-protoporphyrin IX monomethyl ester cyclase